jgi:DNA polymerase III epsilon subunit-like protein
MTSRLEIMQEAQRLLQLNPIYLDTETTGTGSHAEIIEIAVIDSDGSILADELVRPKGYIDPEAQRVHNIPPEVIRMAPSWPEVWPKVRLILQDRMVGVYNSEFDLRLLRQSHQRSWLRWDLDEHQFFCIMKLFAAFNGDWDRKRNSYRWLSLEEAALRSGLELSTLHRAADDARLARAVLHAIAGWKLNIDR